MHRHRTACLRQGECESTPGAAQSLARGIHSYSTAGSPFRVFACRPVSAKKRKAPPLLPARRCWHVDWCYVSASPLPCWHSIQQTKTSYSHLFYFLFFILSLFYNFDYYCISFIVSCNAIVANVIYYMLLLYIVSIVDAVLHMYTNNSLNWPTK